MSQSQNYLLPITDHQDYLLPIADNITWNINRHSNAADKGRWRGLFNIMTWLYSPTNVSGQFQLELIQQDTQGEQIVTIDQCTISHKNNILLTSRVALSFSSPLQAASLHVAAKTTQQKSKISILEWLVEPAKN